MDSLCNRQLSLVRFYKGQTKQKNKNECGIEIETVLYNTLFPRLKGGSYEKNVKCGCLFVQVKKTSEVKKTRIKIENVIWKKLNSLWL